MKKLILLGNFILFCSLYSYERSFLQELTKKRILDYPTFIQEQKDRFNESGLRIDPKKQVLSFKNERLEFFDFTGIRLCGVDFSGAYVKGIYVKGIDLEGADLRYYNFKETKFINCNFKGSILIGVNLEGCCFKGANLKGAILTEDLQLSYYIKTSEILGLYSVLKDENNKKILNMWIGTGSFGFSSQKIIGLDLTRIAFKDCSLNYACIENCNLTDAQFKNTDLRNTSFLNTYLFKDFKLIENTKIVDLIRLYGQHETTSQQKKFLNKLLSQNISYNAYTGIVCLENLNLRKIDLSNAMLARVYFQGSNLTGVKLNGKELSDIQWQKTTLPNWYMVPEYENEIDLVIRYKDSQDQEEKNNLNYFFNIYSLNLTNQDLKGFNFSKMRLQGAQLQGVTLFDDFTFPYYQNASDLLKEYSQASLERRKQFNQFFDVYSAYYFSFQDLSSLNLEGIHLKSICFYFTNLKNCNLKNALLPKKMIYSSLARVMLLNGSRAPEYNICYELIKIYNTSKDPAEKKQANKVLQMVAIEISKIDCI